MRQLYRWQTESPSIEKNAIVSFFSIDVTSCLLGEPVLSAIAQACYFSSRSSPVVGGGELWRALRFDGLRAVFFFLLYTKSQQMQTWMERNRRDATGSCW